jgi:hypothetical protein
MFAHETRQPTFRLRLDGGPDVVSLSALSPRADLRNVVEKPSGLVLDMRFGIVVLFSGSPDNNSSLRSHKSIWEVSLPFACFIALDLSSIRR